MILQSVEWLILEWFLPVAGVVNDSTVSRVVNTRVVSTCCWSGK